MTARPEEVVIRSCRGFDEFEACVRLQGEIWGYDKDDLIPTREFIVIDRIGGQVIGAFAGKNRAADDLIGFAMAMPALSDSGPYLHSHMLAVKPEYRNVGIGRKLKLAQREDALKRDILRMDWTFDPLEIKNAYLNIHRLGTIVRTYSPNFYGVFSSRLQGGLPTDRLHAEWWMNSNRVRASISGDPVLLPEVLEAIEVPGAVAEWKRSSEGFARAEAAQAHVRRRFQDAFGRGLAVVGFVRQNDAGSEPKGVYQLAHWSES